MKKYLRYYLIEHGTDNLYQTPVGSFILNNKAINSVNLVSYKSPMELGLGNGYERIRENAPKRQVNLLEFKHKVKSYYSVGVMGSLRRYMDYGIVFLIDVSVAKRAILYTRTEDEAIRMKLMMSVHHV